MDIDTYLKTQRITQGEFAEKLGVTQSMVGHWIHGRHRVTAERARKIEAATGGLVSGHDLRPDIFEKPDEAAA